MSGKRAMRWAMAEEESDKEDERAVRGGERRTGDEPAVQRSLLETEEGGGEWTSSKKALFPHTMADMVSTAPPLLSRRSLHALPSSSYYSRSLLLLLLSLSMQQQSPQTHQSFPSSSSFSFSASHESIVSSSSPSSLSPFLSFSLRMKEREIDKACSFAFFPFLLGRSIHPYIETLLGTSQWKFCIRHLYFFITTNMQLLQQAN